MADDEAVETEDRQESDSGGDSAEGKAAQREERDPAAGGGDGDDDAAASKAKEKEEERDKAKETMEELEENPPEKLEDWPDDAAKYETFGGPEGEESYDESVTSKLGPSSLRHHEDGKVTVEGEEVDNPDDYKGDPIPGGPTDPDAPQDSTTKRVRGDQDDDDDSSGDDDSDDDSSEERDSEQESS
jgi:hypothetical protein